MGKVYVQKFWNVLTYSGALVGDAAISGSALCAGYSSLLGHLYTSSSSETASGLKIEQSVDGGSNWDLMSASDAVNTLTGSLAYNVGVIGNAIKVTFTNGATDAAAVRTLFHLRPI